MVYSKCERSQTESVLQRKAEEKDHMHEFWLAFKDARRSYKASIKSKESLP